MREVMEAVFHACLNRAGTNIGHYPDAVDRFMRLGLKAQSECRTTLEALAKVKNSRAVAFVRQANIANDNQQVINEARAGEVENQPNELLEGTHVTRLDAGAARKAVRGDSSLATVEAIDRPKSRPRARLTPAVTPGRVGRGLS